ncbi:MAG TPA: NAD(P)/FAD-dependent oxidoreductase [Actinomycetes bacterium]|nr:NAD(P)/FAD-dependent oxidoreductase [Actinomycetes bacterium]
MTDVDAVVVGSGPNGLVAAVRLAQAGLRVVVLEAAERVGGGLRTEELTLPGFRHDVCATVHALAQAAVAFRELGLERDGLTYAHPPVPLGHPLDALPAVILDRDVDTTARGLGRDGRAWRTLVASMAAAGPEVVDGLLSPMQVPPRHPLRLAAFGARGIWPATWVNAAAFREPRARALFAGVSAHAILPLTSPATSGYGLMLASLAHSVGWPVAVGGSQAIADALVRRLRSLGGEVVTGTDVRRLSALPSHRVALLDITPRQFLRIADAELSGRYRRALERYRYGPGVFKLDWALDGPVPWGDERLAAAGTVHLGGRAEEIVAGERTVSRGGHPERPYVLFVQASVADPSRAPAGKQTGWAYCHVPNGSTVDMTGAIEAQLERFAPGFRERVLARHAMGPAALEAHNANEVGGDISGGAADLRQFVARPVLGLDPWSTPLPDVYLCSASTPPGGGVHGMGGWHAAAAALRRM